MSLAAVAGVSSIVAGSLAALTMSLPADPAALSSTAQIAQVAASCLPADKVPTAVAIKLAESGHRWDAVNDDPSTGDLSYGGWQINMLGAMGPARRQQLGLGSNDDLVDPVTNARAMCHLSGGGENWAPWSTYTNGAYLEYLPEAEAAAGAAPSLAVAAPEPRATDRAVEWCGVAKWIDTPGDCAEGLQGIAATAWAATGGALDDPATPKLHAAWDYLNGEHPTGTPAPTSPANPAPAPAGQLSGSDGLQSYFSDRLARLAAAAPGAVTISSGYRTVDEQLALGGGSASCGVWVACVTNGVCGSMHCKGLAADLAFADGATQAWVHDHAAAYGLTFPMSYEPWHVEPTGARG